MAKPLVKKAKKKGPETSTRPGTRDRRPLLFLGPRSMQFSSKESPPPSRVFPSVGGPAEAPTDSLAAETGSGGPPPSIGLPPILGAPRGTASGSNTLLGTRPDPAWQLKHLQFATPALPARGARRKRPALLSPPSLSLFLSRPPTYLVSFALFLLSVENNPSSRSFSHRRNFVGALRRAIKPTTAVCSCGGRARAYWGRLLFSLAYRDASVL